MKNLPVDIIAFREFDNLGVGYLASVLSEAGYKPLIIDFQIGKEEILKIIKNHDPVIVGFSVIFQYHIYEFEELIRYLREGGIKCHFTAGGQFASLRSEELFEMIPSLDTIVRFEGERTFPDLVNHIYKGTGWKDIPGIAYKTSGKIKVNPLRPVETDLDKYPFPIRSPLREYAFGKKFATIVAGRGCVNNCSFCFLNEYYQQSSGPHRRIRKPEKVVLEIESLFFKEDCSVFLFQDDDFPVKTARGSEWIEEFCNELKRKKLDNKIMWKINCRPDEIDCDSFTLMKNYGLFLVFLGIEDGTDTGLTMMNKHMTVSKCIEGINILKKLGISFDYGFMPFHPSATFSSVKDNLEFLREICGDGFSPVTFLKMMPYCATPVERELRNSGRLKGKPGFYDYDFLDLSLNHYYKFTSDCLISWFRDSGGLLNVLKWARNYISVFSHYFELTPDVTLVAKDIRRIISDSNIFLLDKMQELAPLFESGKYNSGNYEDLNSCVEEINLNHDKFIQAINDSIKKLLYIADRQIRSKLVFT
jgi:anaerobic magnesium-protoporphyrin IX monomethyl ester cyclase